MLTLEPSDAREQAAYRLWLETYHRTLNPRHLATAHACLAMAQEIAGAKLSADQIAAYARQALATLQRITAASSTPDSAHDCATP